MKGGSAAGIPVLCVVSPLCLHGGLIEGWEWCVLCCPRVSCCPRPLHSVPCLRIGSGLRIVRSLLALYSLVLCYPLPVCVVVLCVENGRVVCVACVVCAVLL